MAWFDRDTKLTGNYSSKTRGVLEGLNEHNGARLQTITLEEQKSEGTS